MTITSSPSAPLFVIIGATGAQGRSVVDASHNDTTQEYRIRALTRDPSRPAAKELGKLGCEVVAGDLRDAVSLDKALAGASIVFAMTLSQYVAEGEEKELQDGKRLVDTIKAAGASTFIFSGLPNVSKITNGRTAVWSFDVKAKIVDYAREIASSNSKSLRIIDVQPGFFMSKSWTNACPRKTPDGRYILPLPFDHDTQIPIIDIEADYGKFALGALKSNTDTVLAASQYVTPTDMAKAFSDFKGEQVTFVTASDEASHTALLNARGKIFADTLTTAYRVGREEGYYGDADLAPSNALLDSPARTFAESLDGHREEVERMFATL